MGRRPLKLRTLFPVLAAFLLGLALSIWLWYHSWEDAHRTATVRFEFQSRIIELALRQRLEAYHQILRGGAGLFDAQSPVSREEWSHYVTRLELEQNYPGIRGLGFTRWIQPEEREQVIAAVRQEGFADFTIWPEGEREAYTAILYLEPFDWRNQRAFGYDMYSEPIRRRAMERARDEGQGVMSDVVVLVQETDTEAQYGFNIYLPVYKEGAVPPTVEQRRQQLLGFVYSPFRISDLLEGVVVPAQLENLQVQIFGAAETSQTPAVKIYDSLDATIPPSDKPPQFEKSVLLNLSGQDWILHFSSRPPFEAMISTRDSSLILIGGFLTSILFASIVGLWGSNRDRAQSLTRVNRDLQQALQERQQAEQNLDRLFRLSPDILCVLNRRGELHQANPAFRKLLGYDVEHWVGRDFIRLFHPQDREAVKLAIQEVNLERPVTPRLELSCPRADGTDCWIEWSFVTAAWEGLLYAYGRDTTGRRESELNRRRLAAVLEGTMDVIFFTDPFGQVLYLNRKGCDLFGQERHPDNLTIYDLCLPSERARLREVAVPTAGSKGFWRGETRILSARGEEIPVSLMIEAQLATDDSVEFFSAMMHDISERKIYEDKLHYQANHDALTGLLNRGAFEARVARALDSTTTRHAEHALLYIDLDHFKVVNDACGHAAGDELLRQLAALFTQHIRERDTLARLGGDEFGLFMEHCSPSDALRVANKLLEAIRAFSYPCRGQIFRVGLSIGLVPINEANNSLKQVLNQADNACYIAKEGGRNRVVVHQLGAEEIMHRREEMNWASRLNTALQEGQFLLCYQPISPIIPSLDDGHWEILLRLQGEEGKLICPGAFLSSAERFGIMPAIDRWVVANTLDYLTQHPDRLAKLNSVTVNISAKSLSDKYFYDYVVERLDTSGLDPTKLCFEITETAALGNLQTTVSFMRRLKERGVRFALDDFGTGMASFSYLKMLPVDYLKIDGSFVETIEHSGVDFEMVRSINEIGHIMGMKTIAEFVTSQSIYDLLSDIGVDYVQGYHIARPRPLPEPA